jgi:hypothetical protein
MTVNARIKKALRIARDYGTIDGAHHKQWVIDQMVRALTDSPEEGLGSASYQGQFDTEDPEYPWDEGLAP